jgi:cytochrome P450
MPKTSDVTLETLQVADEDLWRQGPPHEIFRELRGRCPVHWSAGIAQSLQDAGFWSVTKAEDVHTVSRDWETFSSASNIIISDHMVPVEIVQGMFIGMDPPKHDRIKSLFQRAFTPKAIAQHEDTIREVTTGVLDCLAERETCDLVTELAQPVVARVSAASWAWTPRTTNRGLRRSMAWPASGTRT